MDYIKNPATIERMSFVIIDEQVAMVYGGYPVENKIEKAILRRVIHTTADFDYLDNLHISKEFIDRTLKALKKGLTIITDTNMVYSGINKKVLEDMGCKIRCYISEEETANLASEVGITRSMASVIRAAEEEGPKLYVFGNAPTALFKTLEIYENYDGNKENLIGIIGVPVGFVGAAESKEALMVSNIPSIAAKGRKGGSNVAAAIVNAILYEAEHRYG
ncbi:MAG: precorrin-8X methylmutase [Firmicutes bacterium HGW-Firmicutes-2]|jgi:precorrin-8X/cobalt-precorrin-8 methylmutase|nr:MAG: precorrin-8X methylmutase [Firmicutes bacterium HGW-Firmicutes-2]